MLPMYVSFLFADRPTAPAGPVAIYIVVIGLLMISRIPTYSFKNLSVAREKARYLLLGCILLAAALLTYLWATLLALCLAYVAGTLWVLRRTRRPGQEQENQNED